MNRKKIKQFLSWGLSVCLTVSTAGAALAAPTGHALGDNTQSIDPIVEQAEYVPAGPAESAKNPATADEADPDGSAQTEEDPLGADGACEGCIYGTFADLPACVNGNGDLHICEHNFPDGVFREYVKENFDQDADGWLTPNKAAAVRAIRVPSNGIFSVSGIEFFSELEILECVTYQLTELNVSRNPELTFLDCSSNQLTELDVSGCPALTELLCGYNKLTELDVSRNPELTFLDCCYNELAELDMSGNPALTKLSCNSNELTELNVSRNPKLTFLDCTSNQLTKLDVSWCLALIDLNCYSNQLIELDVSRNTELVILNCYSNQLMKLDVSQSPTLTHLNCSHNELTELDVSQNSALTDLYCSYNQLMKLDLSQNQNLIGFNYTGSLDLPAEIQNGEYVFDFSDYLSADELSHVKLDMDYSGSSIKSYDPQTGLLTFWYPNQVHYTYDTGNDTFPSMDVYIDCTVPCEHVPGTWEVQTAATCTEPGLEVQYCTQCGQIVNTREIPATGHQWGEWIIETPATVGSDGLQYRVCQSCGEREEQVIPAYGYVPGDTDGDGVINGKDLLLMEQVVNGWDSTLIAQNADLNGDGKVNAADLLLMYQKINNGDV